MRTVVRIKAYHNIIFYYNIQGDLLSALTPVKFGEYSMVNF